MSDKNWRDIAKKTLLNAYNSPVRDYATYERGRKRNEDAVSIVVDGDVAYQRLSYVRQLLPEKLIAFIGATTWIFNKGYPPKSLVEVVIAPGETQYDILLVAQTADVNGTQTTGDLIQRLQQYDALYGIDIYHAATDSVTFRLKKLPDDLDSFVLDIEKFCPDTIDQIHGSCELLRQKIEDTWFVYVWWD